MEDFSIDSECNNNNTQLGQKLSSINYYEPTAVAASMPCNSAMSVESAPVTQQSGFEVMTINPCYVTAISDYHYEAFQMATGYVEHTYYEKGRLAQMRANTKLKRTRKPYQIPYRGAFDDTSRSFNTQSFSTSFCGAKKTHLDRSNSNRVKSLFNDWPSRKKPLQDLHRSKSLDDLRSLAKTTTVNFKPDSPQNKTTKDCEIEECSSVLSKLQVSELT